MATVLAMNNSLAANILAPAFSFLPCQPMEVKIFFQTRCEGHLWWPTNPLIRPCNGRMARNQGLTNSASRHKQKTRKASQRMTWAKTGGISNLNMVFLSDGRNRLEQGKPLYWARCLLDGVTHRSVQAGRCGNCTNDGMCRLGNDPGSRPSPERSLCHPLNFSHLTIREMAENGCM